MLWFTHRLWQIRRNIAEALRSESGAATAEYALLLALVVVMLMTTLQLLGQTLQGRLEDIIDSLGGGS